MHNSIDAGRKYRQELYLLTLSPWSSREEFVKVASTKLESPAHEQAIADLAVAYARHELPRPEKWFFGKYLDWATDRVVDVADNSSLVLDGRLDTNKTPLRFLNLPRPVECMAQYKPSNMEAELWFWPGIGVVDCTLAFFDEFKLGDYPKSLVQRVVGYLEDFAGELGIPGSLVDKFFLRIYVRLSGQLKPGEQRNWDVSIGLSDGARLKISKSLENGSSAQGSLMSLIETGLSFNRIATLLSDSNDRSSGALSTQSLWNAARPAWVNIGAIKWSWEGKASPLPAAWPLEVVAGGVSYVSLKPIPYRLPKNTK